MRLTNWSDYSLRVLMFCAACAEREQPATVSEIAEAHGISRSHLTKIVMTLSAMGWLETTRGRGGGLRLLKPASEIVLGDVIRQTETDFTLVECFDDEHNTCLLDGHCRLKGVFKRGHGRLPEGAGRRHPGRSGAAHAHPPGGGARSRVRWLPGLPSRSALSARRPQRGHQEGGLQRLGLWRLAALRVAGPRCAPAGSVPPAA